MATLRDYYSLQKAWRCSWAIRCAIWSSGTSRTKTACRSPRKIRNSSTPFSNTALPHPWARMRFRNSRAFLKILFVWKIKCRKYTKFRRIQTRNKRIKSLKKKNSGKRSWSPSCAATRWMSSSGRTAALRSLILWLEIYNFRKKWKLSFF